VRKNVPNASITGVIFSPMVETNDITREIFVGFKRDESFGNILFL
jgi:acyl-CoA synthetase (NDP forming)